MLRKLLYKSYIALYRVTAVFVLYGMLIAIGTYAFIMGFYAINASWAAPVLISPSNDKILSMTAQLVASQQALDTMTLTNSNLEKSQTELIQRRAVLIALDRKLDGALARDRQANAASGNELSNLVKQKKADLKRSSAMLGHLDKMRADIERDLHAGLITKSEALTEEMALSQYQNQYTDGQVGEVILRDNVRQKLAIDDLSAVDTMSKQVELKSEIAQLDVQIRSNNDQIANNQAQIATIQAAIKTTSKNPYYQAAAAKTPLGFAFVPYDNQKAAVVGTPVFDCFLSMLACRQVGTVERVFTDEEKATNPIYRNDMRGFMVQLSLSREDSVKSKTLFLGRKPFYL